jgi:hypothetical protein
MGMLQSMIGRAYTHSLICIQASQAGAKKPRNLAERGGLRAIHSTRVWGRKPPGLIADVTISPTPQALLRQDLAFSSLG